MRLWTTRILGAVLFLAFAVQLGCEYTGEVTVVRPKGFYCKKNSKCARGYEEYEISYFACKEDAEAAGYKCCPKHAAKMKPEKKVVEVKEEVKTAAKPAPAPAPAKKEVKPTPKPEAKKPAPAPAKKEVKPAPKPEAKKPAPAPAKKEAAPAVKKAEPAKKAKAKDQGFFAKLFGKKEKKAEPKKEPKPAAKKEGFFEKLFGKKKEKEEASSCATCPMRDTCDKKPGPYTGPVIGTKSDKIYRKKGCPCLKKFKKEDMVEFKCKKAAAKAGYKPCLKCDNFKDKPEAKKPAPAPVKKEATPAAKKAEPAKKAKAKDQGFFEKLFGEKEKKAEPKKEPKPAAKKEGFFEKLFGKKKKAKAAKKEEASSCDTCPMKDTCDKQPGPYTGPVIGIKSQKIYAKKGCPCLKDVKKEDMVEFKCKKDAAAAGYKPCSECPCFKDQTPCATCPKKPTCEKKPEAVKPAPAPAKPAAQPAPKPAAKAEPKKAEPAKPAPAPAKPVAKPEPKKAEPAKPAPAPAKK